MLVFGTENILSSQEMLLLANTTEALFPANTTDEVSSTMVIPTETILETETTIATTTTAAAAVAETIIVTTTTAKPTTEAIFNSTIPVFDSVNSHQVQNVVNVVMVIIIFLIITFLLSHYFIRMHYKAKTDYAVQELKKTFEMNQKAPSPFAAPKITDSPRSKELVVQKSPEKPFEIVMNADQLAPILHHMALGQPPKATEANKQVVYVGPARGSRK